MKKYVIIAAGGSGSRMSCLSADRNTATPKQFLLLAGKPILMHAINAFYQCDAAIKVIVVLPGNHISEWKQLCEQHNFTLNHTIAEGGETRFHSVKNGLALITEDSLRVSSPASPQPSPKDRESQRAGSPLPLGKGSGDGLDGLIAIHDGVRPLVSTQLINKVFETTERYGSVIPAIPVDESIRKIIGDQNKAVDRKDYRIIQTPQCFSTGIIKHAYEQAYNDTFTDEASVVEAAGEKIHLIEGEIKNIKITTPQDLLIAEMLMK